MASGTRIQQHGLIVAYDFGTSYSGVAAKALSPDPLVLTDFPYQAAYSPYPKMPTLSLYQLPPGGSDPEGTGIIPSPQSQQLELLHEPEAAAIAMVRELKPYLSLKHGDTVLVIDLGGGTADITLHELVPNLDADGGGAPYHLKEVACRRAELAGSTFVDDRFEAWLEGRLGLEPDGFGAWKASSPRDRLKLMRAWEEQKRIFGEGWELRDCKVQLPDTLWKLLPAHTRRDLSSASASRAAAACTDDPPGWCDADYAVVGDDDEEESGDDDEPYVYIKADTMVEEMFEPVVDTIAWALRPVLAWDGGRADWVLASGGFSASPYVMQRLREEVACVLADKDIVTVPNPGAAVLKGAALFGDNLQLVAARISTLAYGVEMSCKYRRGMPGKPFISNITGARLVDHCFQQFVKRDHLVVVDETVEHTFSTTRQYQDSVTFNLFCTTDNSQRYTSQPGMRRLASLVLDLPPPHGPHERHLQASFRFGTAEIQVTAVDTESGKSVTTSLEFVAGV
ncbi:Heat shock protein 12A [Monoraphidium neglectum]|uniref:Heat shock protein 12A n=1 Tax=Monoraphidium neglectum TaxID=145388 RepID=A0A0D2MWX7_9CHLO|nr:Heat shock protein 12A [Monoraphidium neglectum]KIZ04947.1 Heat shock protein 12A [Monoraphidium neglectum]|eukprot:XP_013903966.1 Heat shock protein 12A [Monoraphidium neglectum]